MHLKSCFYFKENSDLLKYASIHSEELKKYSNKFRCYVLLYEENVQRFENISINTSIITYPMLTNFLTYQDYEQEGFAHPSTPHIIDHPSEIWIHDIDVWVGLPKNLWKDVMNLGSHVFCFEEISFIHDI